MKDRIKQARNVLGMTQTQFGEKIGATRDAISAYERGATVSKPISKLISKVFNIDYFWLTEGIGDMFTNIPETLLDELSEQYHLNDDYKVILKTFLDAPDSQKETIKNFLITLVENLQKKDEI